MRRAIGDPVTRARALGELRAFRERVLVWQLADHRGIVIVEPGLLALYSDGRRRWERCERGKGDQVREMHQWRKRVKDLRYVAEMLDVQRPAAQGSSRGKDERRCARSHRARTRSENCSAKSTTWRCSRSGSR